MGLTKPTRTNHGDGTRKMAEIPVDEARAFQMWSLPRMTQGSKSWFPKWICCRDSLKQHLKTYQTNPLEVDMYFFGILKQVACGPQSLTRGKITLYNVIYTSITYCIYIYTYIYIYVYIYTYIHHITSHHITSHHITSHHITSHHITSHHITSHHSHRY